MLTTTLDLIFLLGPLTALTQNTLPISDKKSTQHIQILQNEKKYFKVNLSILIKQFD